MGVDLISFYLGSIILNQKIFILAKCLPSCVLYFVEIGCIHVCHVCYMIDINFIHINGFFFIGKYEKTILLFVNIYLLFNC